MIYSQGPTTLCTIIYILGEKMHWETRIGKSVHQSISRVKIFFWQIILQKCHSKVVQDTLKSMGKPYLGPVQMYVTFRVLCSFGTVAQC